MAHYFLAIPIPEMLQENYSKQQKEIKDDFPYKRWTAKGDFHITLKFLGETSDTQIETLTDELRKSLTVSSFEVMLGGIGSFGEKNRPRVLFRDVQLNDELKHLHQAVDNTVGRAGFPKEKRSYRPHITLGKKWNSSESLAPGKFEEWKEKFSGNEELHVTEIILYKIHPKRIPSYEAVFVFPLNS